MIIRSLKLENIRSYAEVEVNFHLGKTLFEGDVGSGKSTILMAIEFALFGLGSERGAALLRAGASKGKVILVFEINGNEYTIERSLVRKRGTIQQIEGSITFPDGKVMDYSPTELKEKVLEILNFNEPPNPKAVSVIYRYAVFTPQEMMKEILLRPADERLQTLRKAFRIEDYRTASENSGILVSEIKDKITKMEGQFANMPELLVHADENRKRITEAEKSLAKLEVSKNGTAGILKNLEEERESLRKEEVKLSKLEGELTPLQSLIDDKKGQIDEAQGEIKRIEKRLGDLQGRVRELEGAENPAEKTSEEIEEEMDALREKANKLSVIKAQIASKKDDYESSLKNGKCPTCDRSVDSGEFSDKVKQKAIEEGHVEQELDTCRKTLQSLKELLEKKRSYEDAQENLQQHKEKMGEYASEIGRLNNIVAAASKEIAKTERRLGEVEKSLENLKSVSAKVEELDQKIGSANSKLDDIKQEITAATTKISGWKNDTEELQKQIEKCKALQNSAETLKEYRIWLEDYFVPSLDLIEKQALLNINQEFNANFQKWFSMLIDDAGKEARVDEEFTPIVQQDGYEQDIYYLSGGERTSVALAYRLALNTIVQRVSAGLHSNLLILDEPTDGFSKEQLAKVREVLDEIQSPQVIIVSHEKELESFADQVFRVTKVQGESKVLHGV